MLQSITWSQYFLVIGLTTLFYYVIIWLLLFKGKIAFLKNVRPFSPASSMGEDAPDEMMTTIQYALGELSPLFAGRRNRSELILTLHKQLAQYKGYDDKNFREAINQFISAESERQCSIRLGEDDLRAVWL